MIDQGLLFSTAEDFVAKFQQVVKVIWQKAASPPRTNRLQPENVSLK